MRYYVVDAFTDKIFRGNPAGVCILEKQIADELMLKITIENGLSEIAFCYKIGNNYYIRWFTPRGEIDLCGHATLAAASVLMQFHEINLTKILFKSLSGNLIVKKIEICLNWIFRQ